MRHTTKLIIILAYLAILSFATADITVTTVVDNQTIAAGGTYTSAAIDLAALSRGTKTEPNGAISIQVAITAGTGTAKIEVLLSNDGVTYTTQDGKTALASGLTTASGPDSDGNLFISVSRGLAAHMKYRVTETGSANSITMTIIQAHQTTR